MKFFQKKPSAPAGEGRVQTRPASHPFGVLDSYVPLLTPETRLYAAMREAIPVIDAALFKIERLIGGFRLRCGDAGAEKLLGEFTRSVPVGAGGLGLEKFVCSYLDSLLLYGSAVGEIVLTKDKRRIAGLYNSPLDSLSIQAGNNPLEVRICRRDERGKDVPVPMPQLILFTALNPQPGRVCGDSVLKSLPFVSSVLLKIYNAVGQNFDRLGNLRFAVTYKPSGDGLDRAYAKERALQIAKEWSEGMAASRAGDIRDFIAVGDVDIKVIGADNQMIDCNLPARQMLEQIVAKLSIPPFMLGLSWSTTERMSQQQADILSNELSYYRRMLNPMIERIAGLFLGMNGYSCKPTVEWDVLNFNDEMQAAQTRLYNAQAAQIEQEHGLTPTKIPIDISTAEELL